MHFKLITPLVLLAVAAGASSRIDLPGALVDASSLLQVSDAKVREAQPEGPRNLVLLLDGAFRNHSGTLWKLGQHLANDPATQVSFYEAGGDNYWSAGLRQAIRGYRFLVEEYSAGDKIFIFAQSRGCVAGRYIQGLVHRFGLLRRSSSLESGQLEPYFEDHLALESLLANSTVEVDTDVEIQVVGFIDAVLRGVQEVGVPFKSLDLRPLHLELTPQVRVLLHAIALEEVSDYMQAAELVVDPSTHAEQVWFMGDHNLICTRNDIMLSWILDRSQEHGLLVQPEFAKHLDLAYCSDSPYKVKVPRNTVVRNPGACRKELYGGTPVKIHQSVRDRSSRIHGWVPLTACCHAEVFSGAIDWVSNPTYDLHKQNDRVPQWLLLKLRVSAGKSAYPLRFMLVMTDHGDSLVDVGPQEHDALPAQALFPYHNFSTEPELLGRSPPSFFVIEGPCEYCPGFPHSFKVGNVNFWISGGAVLIDNVVHGSVGRDVSMDLQTEPVYDDEVAAKTFKMPISARCSWLHMNTAKRYHGSVCPPSLPADYPSTCEQLRTEASVGVFHSGEKAKIATKYYDEILRLSRRQDFAMKPEMYQMYLQDTFAAVPHAFREQWAMLLEEKPWLAIYENTSSKMLEGDVMF